ncbi:phosphatidate cytidylyltransferase [Sulfitobacter donghicola DSW-25 = KCTC 12864 = JCM 14565]|uniref:Phosphatidate cytidylyltransferase n=1 Tax=Sulfitobacter donghicola DSW-25 = KCTC 12864 = JCM 14565 TaxID=1300350 RepID=A0A073IFU6_9RHOB|nr:phosphatidate cytidylyltransferase [Sulfitobacter donghicola DSW-25 = KCTC 12864 = JCM 14565]
MAVIAGRGDLPALVAGSCEVQPLICGYEGVELSGLSADITYRLETLGSLLLELGNRGVTQVCFAGGLDRPALDPTKLDAETAPLVPMFMQALQQGDDGALRVVVELFEKTGFEVLAAHQVAPDLLAKGGVYGEHWPDAQMRADAEVAAAHVLKISAQDLGQACVVGDERVLGMEDAAGTDALLAGLPANTKKKQAILFKGPKENQSRLIDLPTVGPETMRAAHNAGLAGVVVDAGDVLVLYPQRCADLADELGLVFWARTGE